MLDSTKIFELLTVEKKMATTISTMELGQKIFSIITTKQTINKYIIHQE